MKQPISRLVDLSVLLANYAKARNTARFGSRAALERHQARAIARFRRTTLAASPFYAPLADKPLADLPIMSKPLMLAEFERINTRGISHDDALALAEHAERTRDFSAMIGDVSVGLSTGTSGRRGLFLASRRERLRWAGIMLGRMLRGSIVSKHRIAFLLRANNQLYESVSGRGRIAFRFFDLKRSFADLRPEIAAFGPTILIAPAQVLRELALIERTARSKGESRLAPQRVISVAETLFGDDRALIETVFAQPVEVIYQATEGFLGYTCSAGRLHLNETFLHVEPDWIDKRQGLFSPIITDFSRETQPIVRYRLDDVLRLDPRPCPCGSHERVISRIEGRADDILMLPSRIDGAPQPLMPDFVARAIAGARANPAADIAVEDFRVCQTASRACTVRLRARDPVAAETAVTRAFATLCAEHAVETPSLAFAPMTDADVLQKRRRIVRQMEATA